MSTVVSAPAGIRPGVAVRPAGRSRSSTSIGPSKPSLPIGRHGHRHASAARDVERLRIERDVEVRRRLAHGQAIRESLPLEPAHVSQPHEVVAVGGRLEVQPRVLAAEARPAIVVDVIDLEDRHAVGLEPRAGRVDLDLVHGLADRVVARATCRAAATARPRIAFSAARRRRDASASTRSAAARRRSAGNRSWRARSTSRAACCGGSSPDR